MVNAVVLAGGRREEYRDNWVYRVLLSYGIVIPGERKAVMQYKRKPMVSHVINALRNSRTIDDIVIVGNKELLERNIGRDVKIIEQGNSIIENAMRGYSYFNQRGNILLVPCDIPEVRDVDEFVLKSDGDFCLAVTDKEHLKKYDGIFRRFYFWALKNGERKKYRFANMAIVYPDNIKHKNKVQFAYDVRKIWRPSNWPKIIREIGWNTVFDYFPRMRLTVDDVEKIASDKFGCKFKIVEINDSGASLDIDHTRDYRKLKKWHKLFKASES